MREADVLPLWRWAWVPVLTAVVFVLKHGYAYGVGDHDEMIPQLLRLLDPDLYPRDWFVVEQGSRFTVRTPFLYVLLLPAHLVGPEAAVAGLYAVALVALGAVVFWTCRAVGAGAPAAALATIGAVGVVPTWALAGDSLAASSLGPGLLAWCLAIPAIGLTARRRPVVAGLLLGGAAYFQLLVGGLTTGALGLAVLLGATARPPRERFRDAFALGLTSLAVAAPMLALVVLDRASGPPVPTGGLSSYTLIAELRLPHHYLPSEFAFPTWVRFGVVLALGAGGMLWLRRAGRPAVFVERLVLGVAVSCAVAGVAADAGRSLFAAQLQMFKLTVPLLPLLLAVGAEGGLDALRLDRLGAWPFRRPAVAWAATGVAVVAAAFLLAGPLSARLQPLAHHASDAGAIERWARTQTDPDALFVIPPSVTWFRTGSQRSVVVTHKPTSFQEGSTHLWYRRLIAVAPAADPPTARGFAFADSLDAAYARNRPEDWQAIAETFGPDYALVDTALLQTPPTDDLVAEAGPWAVYRLGRPRGGSD